MVAAKTAPACDQEVSVVVASEAAAVLVRLADAGVEMPTGHADAIIDAARAWPCPTPLPATVATPCPPWEPLLALLASTRPDLSSITTAVSLSTLLSHFLHCFPLYYF